MNSNGDSPVQYVITQGAERWVVKLSAPDDNVAKLATWVQKTGIEGEIMVSIEWTAPDGRHRVGPMKIDAGTLR